MKSPSQFDGKPIGAAMDAKSPFHAGVTTGKDQIERMEEQRRLRNRLLKAHFKSERKKRRESITPEEWAKQKKVFRQRWKRADNITRGLRRGTSTASLAKYWNITPDEVLAEAKWLSANRNKRRTSQNAYPELPKR